MARESIFIEEFRQLEPPSFELVQSTHADVLVDLFIQALRECFFAHPIYTYIPREDSNGPDLERTQIVIVDRDQEQALFLPIITSTVNSINTMWIQFSQSPFNTVLKPQIDAYGNIKRDSRGRFVPSHYEYTGAYEGSMSFLISAEDTIEREELANLLHVFLAEVLRDTLYKRGVFVKTVSVGGMSETAYRNKQIFQMSVNVDIYSEWRRKIPVGETLKSIGFNMNVTDGLKKVEATPIVKGAPLPIYDLSISPYIVDPISEVPTIPSLELSATSVVAPIALLFNTTSLRWEVSPFWIEVLDSTLIPYENYSTELTRESPTREYLRHAVNAILQAEVLRALSLTQGRVLADGTRVIKQSLIYTDGSVDLRGEPLNKPTIYSTVVAPNNNVTIRLTSSNKNKAVLVAKNVTSNSEGEPTGGQIYKKYVNNLGVEVEVLVSTLDDLYLDGESLATMTAVDLFMILQFASQPYRYTLPFMLKQIDSLLIELANMSLTISLRSQKIANITSIKQDLITRSERYLIRQPTGL